MKNRKFTYLLIFSVVALWGIIFYRIFMAIGEQEEPLLSIATKKTNYFKEVNHLDDEVVLDLGYRDPFSSSQLAVTAAPASINVKPQPVLVAQMPKPMVNWQAIAYIGYISNNSSRQKLAVMVVNGKEFVLTEGQNQNGIKLLKYAVDSVKVQYQNEVKYVKLK